MRERGPSVVSHGRPLTIGNRWELEKMLYALVLIIIL